MPPPPPPAPPPPPGLLNIPKPSNDRSKLLNDIQKGAKLKKTVTNDRSAPIVGGSKPLAGKDSNSAIKPSLPGNSSSSSSAPTPAGIGGLFANGLPKKPSDNKNKKFAAPEMKPGPPPVSTIKAATASVVPPPKPLNSLSIKQDGNTTHFPSSVNAAPQTTNSVPPPPPPMPQMKQKAPPPEAPPAAAKPNQAQKFSTIRPQPPANKPQQLRRTGSTEEAPSIQTSRPVARPAAPPPPPPSRPPVRSTPSIGDDNEPPPPPPPPRHTSVAAPSAANSQWHSPNISIASGGSSSRPFPSSNQKNSSTSLSSAGNFTSSHQSLNSGGGSGMIKPFEERFHFLSINELPPPEPFKNFPKTYDQPRTAAN